MATACSVSPSSRNLADIANPPTGVTVTYVPTDTAGGDTTYDDVDTTDTMTIVDVWVEFIVDTSGVQSNYGQGSGLEHPSWLSYTVTDLGNAEGNVNISIDMDPTTGLPITVDYMHIGIEVSDGINPNVSAFHCFNSPY